MRLQHFAVVGLSLLLGWTQEVGAHSIVFPASTPSDHPPSAQKALSSGSASHGPSTQRATKDLPDDFPGYQVHVMYVLPSDGADNKLDVNGTIATSVKAMQKWLVGQTKGTRSLRLDTRHGKLDITFFRLAQTDAEIASAGAEVRDRIQDQLKAAGFNNPKKIYAVYYGGSSTYACGGGAWPPELIGPVAALYLNGAPPGDVPPCASNPFAESADKPGYWEFSLIHEIFHVLGAVATCALHHTMRGHVSDSPNDLMYAGDLPWTPSVLDLNHDNYFGHHNPSCLDVAKSVFINPVAKDAVAPPGWIGGPKP